MDFLVLGPLEVRDGDDVVALGGPKMRAVLAVLLVHANTVVSADRLLHEVWGEEAPKSARRSLHSYISKLRRSLNVQREILRGVPPGYVLEVDAESLDSARFESSVESARAQRTTDPGAASDLLEDVLLMWRGSPFDLVAGDVPSVQIESTRLEELRLAAVELRIDCELEAGRGGSAIGELERLVAEHPLREGFWRQLMLALYGSGRQGEALGAYQRARRVLSEELGMEPSRELQLLEERILRQDLAVDDRTIQQPAPGGPASLRLASKAPQPPGFLTEQGLALEPVREVFVGREEELDRLNGFLDRALAGAGKPVFVAGQAGTGKTALVTEFVERAQAVHPDLVVAGGTCESLTSIGDPYLPFREVMSLLVADCELQWAAGVISRDHALRLWRLLPTAVQALCDVAPSLLGSFVSARELAARARAFGAGGEPWVAQLEHVLAAQTGRDYPPPPEKHRTFAEYAGFLVALADRNPLAVIIDDLHWADASSIQLFSHLGRQLDGRRILLIGTYRPEDVARGREGDDHPLADLITTFKHRMGDTSLDLDRGEATEGRRFVDALIDAEPNELRDDFRAQLAELSGGRALFAVELLRHVQARGDLERNAEGRWVEVGRVAWEALPARVEGVIEQLFAGLDSELRDALLVASVAGVEFTAEVVAAVQDLDESRLIHRLSQEAGRQHRLVEARGAHRTETQRLSRYRFRHSLFQKFLYDSLDPVELAYLHEAVGNAIETLYEHHVRDVAVQLAGHFQEAGIADKSGLYLQQAGDRAAKLAAHTEAIGYYNQALQILEAQPQTAERAGQELALLVKGSLALQSTEGYWSDRVKQGLSRATALSEELGASPELFAALRGLWHYHHSRLELEQASELADRLLTIARDESDPVLIVQAHWMLGENGFFAGEINRARDHLEQAIATYDPVAYRSHPYPAVLDPGVICRLHAATTQWVLGYPDRAAMDMAEALALAQEQPRSLTLGVAYGVAGNLREFRRENELALQIADEMIEMASEANYEIVLGAGRFNRGAALAELGNVDEGIRLMQEGLTAYRGAFLPRALASLAAAHWKARNVAEGLAAVAEALAVVDRAGGYFMEAELKRLEGELHLLAGGGEVEAGEIFSAAIDIAQRQGAKSYQLRAVMSLSRLLRAQGRDEAALEMLSDIYGWFTEGLETGDLREARALLDELVGAD